MNKTQLFLALRRHRQLASKRSIDYKKNKAAKFFMWFMGCFMVVYFLFMAISLSSFVKEDPRLNGLEVFGFLVPFILTLDYLFRLMLQQTPAHIVKPYLLLNVRTHFLIDSFIYNSMLSPGNLIWFILVLPFTLMSILPVFHFWTSLALLVWLWIMILANSQFYLISRTLIYRSLLWVLLPVAFYALMFVPFFLGDFEVLGLRLSNLWSTAGTQLYHGNPLPILLAIVLSAALAEINKRVQYKSVYDEISADEKPQEEVEVGGKMDSLLQTIGQRFSSGHLGSVFSPITLLYIRLEILSIKRNKNIRSSFLTSIFVVALMSVSIIFSDVYDGALSGNFWCLYDYVLMSLVLIHIMCPEGNYIDLLMVHKENVLKLLHAKYVLYVLLLFFPFLLMLPVVIAGKWPMSMVVADFLFTAGFQYFLLFNLAPYNDRTMQLNQKMANCTGVDTNARQLVATFLVFTAPTLLFIPLNLLFSETTSYFILSLIGIIFILSQRFWMRSVYKRLMARRYDNMAGFRSTR